MAKDVATWGLSRVIAKLGLCLAASAPFACAAPAPAAAGVGIHQPREHRSANGTLDVTLTLGTSKVSLVAGDGGSGDDESDPGHFDNPDAVQPISCTPGGCTGLHGSTFHAFNFTNLHTHGLHVSPALGADDVLDVKIPPGGKYAYEYAIPKTHAPGTFWYHPHFEGSTAVQVMGGAAGAIVIDDDDDVFEDAPRGTGGNGDNGGVNRDGLPRWLVEDVPEVVVVLQQIPVGGLAGISVYANDSTFSVDEAGTTVLPGADAGGAGDDDAPAENNQNVPTAFDPDGNPVSFNASRIDNVALVNGAYRPTLQLVSGEWQRWRLLNAGALFFLDLALHEAGTGSKRGTGGKRAAGGEAAGAVPLAPCELQLLAIDGIYVEMPREVDRVILTPAGRADVLVRCRDPTASDSPFVLASGLNPGQSGLLSRDMYWNPVVAYVQVAAVANDSAGAAAQVAAENAPAAEAAASLPAAPVGSHRLPVAGPRLGGGLKPFTVSRPPYLTDLRRTPAADVSKFSFEFEDLDLVNDPSSFDARPLYVHNGDQSGTCTFNNMTYAKGQPLLTVYLGTVQEWAVSGVQAHPLHVHVNPMQLQSFSVGGHPTGAPCDAEYGFFCAGDWVDTLQLPNAAAGSAGAVVRFTPLDFTGDMVIHCHYLVHEDQGCLTYALIKKKGEYR